MKCRGIASLRWLSGGFRMATAQQANDRIGNSNKIQYFIWKSNVIKCRLRGRRTDEKEKPNCFVNRDGWREGRTVWLLNCLIQRQRMNFRLIVDSSTFFCSLPRQIFDSIHFECDEWWREHIENYTELSLIKRFGFEFFMWLFSFVMNIDIAKIYGHIWAASSWAGPRRYNRYWRHFWFPSVINARLP